MKDVQCYELFVGIALKNHAFSFFMLDTDCFVHESVIYLSISITYLLLSL